VSCWTAYILKMRSFTIARWEQYYHCYSTAVFPLITFIYDQELTMSETAN
jgi:hypothetical protein